MPIPKIATALSALILLGGLAACDKKPADRTDTLDNELVNGIGGDVDPALTSALGNQIVVDPARAGKKSEAAKAGSRPTLGDLARAQTAGAKQKCDFRYDVAWAGKLPADLPVYPAAKVSGAAGSDAAGCRRRIVSFTSADPVGKIVEFYRARVTRAGYSVEHLVEQGSDILGGTRGEAAYYVSAAPAKGGGTSVDLIANTGG